ncbi:hypothetical protein KIPB_005672, partial [Kipferlia bialata]
SGSLSLCRTLFNYSVLLSSLSKRSADPPLFMCLDPSTPSPMAKSLSLIAASDVPRPFNLATPHRPHAVLHPFSDLIESQDLYLAQVSTLIQRASRRLMNGRRNSRGGAICKLPSVLTQTRPGRDLLIQTLEILNPSLVLVVNHPLTAHILKERGFNGKDCSKLVKNAPDMSAFVRGPEMRRRERQNSVREYFWGPSGEFTPIRVRCNIDSLPLYKAMPPLDQSALPIGEEPMLCDVSRVTDITDMRGHVLAVIAMPNPRGDRVKVEGEKEDAEPPTISVTMSALSSGTVLGYISVSEANGETGDIQYLAPRSGPLPPSSVLFETGLVWNGE